VGGAEAGEAGRPGEHAAEVADATRRTLLANERTEPRWALRALAAGVVVLGLLTAILILLD